MKKHFFKTLCGALAAVALWAPALWAAFGEDTEAPVPAFARQGDAVVATLVPRGKSSTISIRCETDRGGIASVTGVPFADLARPEVEVKDFRSALFEVTVDGLAAGDTARLSFTSRYFNSSTRWWVFTAARTPAWSDAAADNVSLPDRVNTLRVAVKDGGPLDSDGAADGRIRLVGGPMDSFWGYALGTLFIRFFGIFLVLGILMLGMMASSRVFQSLEKRRERPLPPVPAPGPDAAPEISEAVPPEHAAAIAVALHRHLGGDRSGGVSLSLPPGGAEGSAWRLQGRARIMGARQTVFDRHRYGKERG